MTMATRQGPTRAARRWAGVLVTVAIATLGLGGCGGDSSSNPLNRLLRVEMDFAPAPATAVASDVEGFDWLVPYRVTLREVGGEIGAAFTSINVTVYEASGDQLGVESESGDSDVEFASNQLPAGGSVDLNFTTHYSLVNGQKAAFVDVLVLMDDHAGLAYQISGRLAVQ